MVRLQKYFLSLFLVLLWACTSDVAEELSSTERRALSMQVLKEGEHLGQGTPRSMTRLERAIEIDPTNADALRELSVAYLKRGMMAEWKERYDKAVIANPEVWIPMRGYLHLLFHRDYNGAIRDFNTADSLTPGFKDAPQGQSIDYWRGIAYLGKKDYKNAILNFENHIALETASSGEDWIETTTFLYLAIAYYEQQQYNKALINIDKMLDYNRHITADGHYHKAKILVELNLSDKAQLEVNLALRDFKVDAYHKHDYVEVINQLYKSDIEQLQKEILKKLTL